MRFAKNFSCNYARGLEISGTRNKQVIRLSYIYNTQAAGRLNPNQLSVWHHSEGSRWRTSRTSECRLRCRSHCRCCQLIASSPTVLTRLSPLQMCFFAKAVSGQICPTSLRLVCYGEYECAVRKIAVPVADRIQVFASLKSAPRQQKRRLPLFRAEKKYEGKKFCEIYSDTIPCSRYQWMKNLHIFLDELKVRRAVQ